MNTVQRIAKNTGIILVGDLFFRLISLVVTIYLARYLDPVGFGKYSFIFAYLAFFDIITDLGLQDILVREMSRDPSAAPKLIGNAYIIRLPLAVFAVVLSIIVISFMAYPADTTTCIYIAAFTILFISFSDFYATIFQANLKMEYREFAKLAFKIISAALILWIIFSHGTLMQVIIALVFSEMVKTLISYLFSRKFVRPRFEIDFGLWKYLLREALPIALSSVIWVIYFRIDVIMLSMMMGDAEVGLYSAAYKLSESLNLIPLALMTSMFPVMSASFKSSEERLVRSYRLSFNYLSIITLPIAVGITILADEIIFLVYGAEFAGSAIALKILIWGLVLASGNSIFGRVLTSIGKQKQLTIITAVCAFGNVLLNFILIPVMSYSGACIASVMTAMIAFFVGFYFVSKTLQVLPIHKILIKPAISAVIMAGFLYYFINHNIILLVPSAAAVYLMALLALRTFSGEDFDLVKRVIGYNK
jgi:O-antigen/teichoic acid export membrane protein